MSLTKRFSSLCLVLFLSCAGVVSAQEQTITIAAEGNVYEAFGSKTTTTVKTVLEALGYKVDIVVLPWARALEKTKQGDFAGLTNVYYSDERSVELAFTDPVTTSDILFYALKSKPVSYSGYLNDLKRLHIAVVRDYTYGDEFDRSTIFQKVDTLNPESSLKLLLAERVDLIVGSRRVVDYLLANKFAQQQHRVDFLPVPLMSKPVYMTFSRKYPGYQNLVKDFNAELAKLKPIYAGSPEP